MKLWDEIKSNLKTDVVITTELLDATIGSGFKPENTRGVKGFKESEIDKDTEMTHEAFMQSKRFLLEPRQAQNFYANEFMHAHDGNMHLTQFNSFELPFKETCFAFRSPIEILWSEKDYSLPRKYEPVEMIAALCVERTLANYLREVDVERLKGTRAYRAYLFFLEQPPEGYGVALSWQFIDFLVDDQTVEGTIVPYHLNHLCSDKKKCEIKPIGVSTTHEVDGITYCDEYAYRKALLETVFFVANSLNNKTVERRINPVSLEEKQDFVLEKSKSGKSIPSPYYVSTLPEVRYEYDHVNVGTGSKHNFKYDVRRHPRIVGSRIIWIGEHRRGSGVYVPKTYTNAPMLSVNSFYSNAETLSKYRFFEILIVYCIKAYRKLKKYI